MYKGSRQCILDIVDDPNFISNINGLLAGSGAVLDLNDVWNPKGILFPKEVELKDFVNSANLGYLSKPLLAWWLAVAKRANTPNWDLISTCKINGKSGILLVEAKAHRWELENESKGKILRLKASQNSINNHQRIGDAIQLASLGFQASGFQNTVSRNNCYQFSNRMAHAWWLANQGIPVVLMYIGFLKVQSMNNGINKLFQNSTDWDSHFRSHAKLTGCDQMIGKRIPIGQGSFQLLVKSV